MCCEVKLPMTSRKTGCVMMSVLCLLACAIPVAAQKKATAQERPTIRENTKKPQTISTTPKVLAGKLQTSDGKTLELRGQAVFTITTINADDSLTGALVYLIPDKDRQRASEKLGKPLTAIPASVMSKEISASFEKDTHCPEIHFAFAPIELEIAGTKLHLDRFSLTLDESPQELSKLFCIWTQVSSSQHQQTRGVIARIRVLLNGEEAEEAKAEGKEKKL